MLLENLAKEQLIKQALTGETKAITLSPTKVKEKSKTEEKDDIFKLPALEDEKLIRVKEESEDICPKKSYNVNINKIDLNSAYFKSLPPDIRHDILTDIKETRKQNSWAKLRELPADSQDFSSYQMAGLLKRRNVQVSLESAEKEMGGKVWSLAELESLLTEDGIIEESSKHAQRIANDANTRFVLVRDITKAMQEAKEAEEKAKNEPKPSTSKQLDDDDENFGEEYDLELQKAIQMSLGQDVEEDIKQDSDSNEPIRLNPEQRKKFGNSVHGLVRGFMMEYAEMNDDDIEDMIQSTQAQEENELDSSLRAQFPHTDAYVLYGTQMQSQNTSKETIEITSDNEIEKIEEKSELVITVDSKTYNKDEDIFADIFETKIERPQTPDVEVASISSSDDDTIDYEIPNDLLEKNKEVHKEVESGFVSEEGKSTNVIISDLDDVEIVQETIKPKTTELVEVMKLKVQEKLEQLKKPKVINEDMIEEPKNIEKPIIELEKPPIESENLFIEEPVKSPVKIQSPVKEICSENEKFWGNLDEQVEVSQICKDLSENEKFWSEALDVNEPVENEAIKVTNGEIKVNLSPQKSLITKQEVDRAIDELRKTKTELELRHMKEDLEQQQLEFEKERNKLNRQGMSITQQMSSDCKKLLRLFGIPYIQSPMEAEAQCAFLNAINITDGTISDDSDIWLFGAQTVYKNFFVQKKMVMEFKMENIEQMMRLDRKKLIQLAMLVGSDYTEGLTGVGAVTALEILAAFPTTPEEEGSTDQYQSMLSSLRKFREWFQSGKQDGNNGKSVLKSKLKNVELFEGFPSMNVLRAYLEPMIDNSTEEFTWGQIDVESLIELARTKLGWTRSKTDEILKPVIKRLNEKKQATIKDYFQTQMKKAVFDNQKLSKRVQMAVGRLGGEEIEEKVETKKSRKRTATKKKPKEEIQTFTLSESDDGEPPIKKSPKPEEHSIPQNESSNGQKPKQTRKRKCKDEPNTSKATVDEPSMKKSPNKPVKNKLALKKKTKNSSSSDVDEISLFKTKQPPRIPETKQVIPQRERDKKEAEEKKQKAIEIFKNSKKSKK